MEVLSPSAKTESIKGALVQPQPGTTLVILRVSSPSDINQKVWLTVARWGTFPKLNVDSGIYSLGPAIRLDAAENINMAAKIKLIFVFNLKIINLSPLSK